jgi:hypothetical protein
VAAPLPLGTITAPLHYLGAVTAPFCPLGVSASPLPPHGATTTPLPPLLPLAPLPLPLVKAALAMVTFIGLIVLPRLEHETSLFLLIESFFPTKKSNTKISINNNVNITYQRT